MAVLGDEPLMLEEAEVARCLQAPHMVAEVVVGLQVLAGRVPIC